VRSTKLLETVKRIGKLKLNQISVNSSKELKIFVFYFIVTLSKFTSIYLFFSFSKLRMFHATRSIPIYRLFRKFVTGCNL